MPVENGELSARFHIPQARGIVCSGRDDLSAIGAEGSAPNRAGVPFENCGLLARFHVP
jgi:hypothetical protein